MKKVCFLILLVLSMSLIFGCDENNLAPEVKSEIAAMPSVSQQVSAQKAELENKLQEFQRHRDAATVKLMRWNRTMALADAQLTWAKHKDDKDAIVRWQEVITEMTLERAQWEASEQESLFVLENELSRQKVWNTKRPGWMR